MSTYKILKTINVKNRSMFVCYVGENEYNDHIWTEARDYLKNLIDTLSEKGCECIKNDWNEWTVKWRGKAAAGNTLQSITVYKLLRYECVDEDLKQNFEDEEDII